MRHTNCKISNLAHECLGFLCKISIKTPRETGVLNSYAFTFIVILGIMITGNFKSNSEVGTIL